MLILVGGVSLRDDRTRAIELDIIELSQKKNPKILFIPFATNIDDGDYGLKKVIDCYSKIWDFEISQLLYSELSDIATYQKKIDEADIIYIGWWYTLRLLRAIRKNGFYSALLSAIEKKVIVGRSAWALIFFERFLSESIRNSKNVRCYTGLWYIPNVLGTAHFSEYGEQELLEKYTLKSWLVGWWMDENTIVIMWSDHEEQVKYYDTHSKVWIYRKDVSNSKIQISTMGNR